MVVAPSFFVREYSIFGTRRARTPRVNEMRRIFGLLRAEAENKLKCTAVARRSQSERRRRDARGYHRARTQA